MLKRKKEETKKFKSGVSENKKTKSRLKDMQEKVGAEKNKRDVIKIIKRQSLREVRCKNSYSYMR